MVWLCYTGPIPGSEKLTDGIDDKFYFLKNNLIFNGAFVYWAVHALYYILLEPFAGLTFSGFEFGLFLLANSFKDFMGDRTAWWVAMILHVLAWYMQLHPGHMVFEGRKPALLTSLFQSFVLAPFFVWFEILFAIGYRPRLRQRCEDMIERKIAAMDENRDSRFSRGGRGPGDDGNLSR